MLTQGLYQMSLRQYHHGVGSFAESKSSLANILAPPDGDGCPRDFKYAKEHPEGLEVFDEDLKYNVKAEKFSDGTGMHTYFEDLKQFDREISIRPHFTGTGKKKKDVAYRECVQDKGLTPIKIEVLEMIQDFDDLLHSGEYEETRKVIEHPDRFVEYSGFWQDPDTGIWLKIRPDNIASNVVIWDLKKHTTPTAFKKQAMFLHYDLQAYMCLEGCSIITGVPHTDFGFIVFHAKSKPYDIEIVMADRDFIASGRDKFYTAILTLQGCLETDKWPGKYEDKIGWLSPTNYRLRQLESKFIY